MNGIKRYYPSDVRLKPGDPQIVLTEHLAGQLCNYEDVEPIIQSNKELETENKELKVEIAQLLKLKAQLDDDNNRLKKRNLILNLQLLTIEQSHTVKLTPACAVVAK
jgi:hypothetical protein